MIKRTKPTKTGNVKVTFGLPATEPHGPVSVVGDFNGWDPYANPLRPDGQHQRRTVITVPAGETFAFRYLADGGAWFDDPEADGNDPRGGLLIT